MTTDIYLAIFFILPIIISIYTYSSFNGKLSKQEDIIKSQQRVLRNRHVFDESASNYKENINTLYQVKKIVSEHEKILKQLYENPNGSINMGIIHNDINSKKIDRKLEEYKTSLDTLFFKYTDLKNENTQILNQLSMIRKESSPYSNMFLIKLHEKTNFLSKRLTEMDKKLNEFEPVFDTLFFKYNNLITENDKILKKVESNQNLLKKAEKLFSKHLPSLEETNKVFKNYYYKLDKQKKLLKALGSTQLYAINKYIYVVNIPKKYEEVVSSIGLKKCDFKNPATGKLETNAWFVTNDYFTKESLSATLVQIFKTI